MTADIRSNNAYEILGLPRGADLPVIRNAFRKLALKHHPDAVPAEEKAAAALRFAGINQAYEVLRHPTRRRHYDALLERGITPNLSLEAGDVSTPGLSEILGDIQSLNLPVDQKALLARMDAGLRDQVLLPSLLASASVAETVIDAVRVSDLVECAGYKLPPGNRAECWLVVTELRIILLLRYVVRYKLRALQHTQTFWRAPSFWYPSLASMLVHERGGTFPSYQIELTDEDGTRFRVELREPRLTRLFLVANAYKLPLKIVCDRPAGSEIRGALAKSLLLPALWCLPFLLCTAANGIGAALGKWAFDPFGTYRPIYDFLAICGLTTLALYFSPLLFTFLYVRLLLTREKVRSAEEVGELKHDFAAGVPREAPAAAASALTRERSAPTVYTVPAEVSSPMPADAPLEVEIPDAVREAMRREKPKE